MKTNIILFCIMVIALIRCGSSHSASEFAEKSDVVYRIDPNVTKNVTFSKNKTDIVFVVDASCSMCIGHFLNELKMISNKSSIKYSIDGRKILLLPEGTKPMVKYYISHSEIFPLSDYDFIDVPDAYSKWLKRYTGCFYLIQDGHITEMWLPKYE